MEMEFWIDTCNQRKYLVILMSLPSFSGHLSHILIFAFPKTFVRISSRVIRE